MTTERHLTLVLPGLMRFEHESLRGLWKGQPRLRALETVLSRSKKQRIPLTQSASRPDNFESIMVELFGLKIPDHKDIPVAALRSQLMSAEFTRQPNMWHVCADPVHLVPQRDQLFNYGSAQLQITSEEAGQLVDEINRVYEDQPWRISVLTPNKWVLSQTGEPELQTWPLDHVIGSHIDAYLPFGNDKKYWHALLNELQMLMYSHQVNQQRAMQGQPQINSVWFWGGGRLPDGAGAANRITSTSWSQCWSNDDFALSLAKLAQVPRVDLPDDAGQWLRQAITAGHHIVVDTGFRVPLMMLDPYDWWQALLAYNNQWIQPVLNAILDGQLNSLTIFTDSGEWFSCNRRMLKQWWKPVKKIA